MRCSAPARVFALLVTDPDILDIIDAVTGELLYIRH